MIDLALVMHGVVTQYPSAEHPAWDLACRTGRPVHAYHSGNLRTYRSPGLGNVIVIEGPQAALCTPTCTRSSTRLAGLNVAPR